MRGRLRIASFDSRRTTNDAILSVVPEEPSGTVTFLFADVEGSTRLLQEYPAAIGAALARYQALLSEIVVAHDGAVFETLGDGVYAAFSQALPAVIAALEAQRALRIFQRVAGLCNDVGLLSEQYDPTTKRMLGNFPQAFSHVSLINTARNLAHGYEGPAEHRPRG